ncbi:MAG: hypothetical protein JWM36_685 [Hyphomicrobiales bacterium]|nr:hypothetical protein [Hyphomicrobiales bacterium]
MAGSAYEIAINGGKIQAPEAVHWMVLVIKAGPDTLLRMLTVSDTPNPADIGEKTFALFAFVLHQRIVIDRIGA